MVDPRLNMELLQHLFDIQMARHTQRARQSHARESPTANVSSTVERASDTSNESETSSTNNAKMGANVFESSQTAHVARDTIISEAIEGSNRLAEQANQLIEKSNQLAERSNLIAERSNQLVERSTQLTEQSNQLAERLNQLFQSLNQHLEQFTQIAKESTKPVENLGDVLGNINKVLVRVQHAIVRNHKGNTVRAMDCLINEKGETPVMSDTTGGHTFADFQGGSGSLSVVIDGTSQSSFIPDERLGQFLRFYNIHDSYFENASSDKLCPGIELSARRRLGEYLTSCLG
ncbi:hypothetical protein B0J17DRAFT_689395 [Rhizoctonia solani]|nr:hypothetical protein B0J17DRAFT_689395 [Rhizoctonia solani]